MTEDLLHFVWKYRSFKYFGLRTSNNDVVEIVDPGTENLNAGPDFFNAKIKIADTIWAGNIEMHLKSSDWFVHGHHTNSAYDNVILHVVVQNDKPAINHAGKEIPTLVVDYPTELEDNLNKMLASKSWIACSDQISQLEQLEMSTILQRLMVERLESKTKAISDEVELCNGDWEEAFYRSITRCFGLTVNSFPAELLAKSLPLRVLSKHRDSLFQLEALIFGQAGMLAMQLTTDDYYLSLCKEYDFLRQKYSLCPIDGNLWKFLRMRPIGFPSIRLAQLASLMNKSTQLFSKFIEVDSLKQVTDLLSVKPSEFWNTHYTFAKSSKESAKTLGKQFVEVAMLNTVIPFMFAYGNSRNNYSLTDKALNFIEEMPAEINSVVCGFKSIGVKVRSAADSQAVVQLKTTRCEVKKCMFCEVGTKLLTKSSLY